MSVKSLCFWVGTSVVLSLTQSLYFENKGKKEGIEKGLEIAKNELNFKAIENGRKALYWSEKNLIDLNKEGHLDEKYKLGSLQMLLRPAGSFEFQGSIFRITSWKTAFDWILREEDYQTLRKRNIEIAFHGSVYKEPEAFITEHSKDIHKKMDEAINISVAKAWNSLQNEL